jgi:hypothetical protein
MPTTIDQVRPLVFSLPPQELRALVVEITAAVAGAVEPGNAGGPASRWERILRRSEGARVGPECQDAAEKFRQDVREAHENLLGK